MPEKNYDCPHCESPLVLWEPCPQTGWDRNLYLCNNDDCPYFVKGRKKISREYEKNFAYRCCYDPQKDKTVPVVTWCGGDLSLLKGRCGA